MLQREEQIFAVFWRERGNAQFYSGQIDSFVLAKRAAVYNFADHFAAAHLQYTQFDQSIRKKNAVAAMNFARQWFENRTDAGGIAEHTGGGDDEALPRLQLYRRFAGQGAGADLGALQIGEDGDGFLDLDGRGAECRDALRVVGVGAVGKIQARDVHAGVEQALDGARGAAGRPDGADNFGVSKWHAYILAASLQ